MHDSKSSSEIVKNKNGRTTVKAYTQKKIEATSIPKMSPCNALFVPSRHKFSNQNLSVSVVIMCCNAQKTRRKVKWHPVFPGGHPSMCQPGPSLLDLRLVTLTVPIIPSYTTFNIEMSQNFYFFRILDYVDKLLYELFSDIPTLYLPVTLTIPITQSYTKLSTQISQNV